MPIDLAGAATSDTTVFSPRAAITAGSPQPISAAESKVRARLRELPMIYILIVVMATFYRSAVLNDDDLVLYYLDVTIIAMLGGIIALLSSRWPISIVRLRGLELGMIGMLAGRVATVLYRLILESSVRGDPLMAQLTTKNIVLLTAILILTYCALRPEERAPRRAGGRAARTAALRDALGPLPASSRGDGLARVGVEPL